MPKRTMRKVSTVFVGDKPKQYGLWVRLECGHEERLGNKPVSLNKISRSRRCIWCECPDIWDEQIDGPWPKEATAMGAGPPKLARRIVGGWAIFHPHSGRFDGWYGDVATAASVLLAFQADYPKESFQLKYSTVGGHPPGDKWLYFHDIEECLEHPMRGEA